MTRVRKPVFTALTDQECRAVLSRNHVGRVAFLNDGVVDIEPVHYAAANSWIFVRSAEGMKLEAFAHSPYVQEVRVVETVIFHDSDPLEPTGSDRYSLQFFSRATIAANLWTSSSVAASVESTYVVVIASP